MFVGFAQVAVFSRLLLADLDNHVKVPRPQIQKKKKVNYASFSIISGGEKLKKIKHCFFFFFSLLIFSNYDLRKKKRIPILWITLRPFLGAKLMNYLVAKFLYFIQKKA
jgi:hypothetical protein